MAAVLILGFLGAAALVAWAFALSITGRGATCLRVFYLAALFVAVIAAFLTTFHCKYYADVNTRFHGWPVPAIIFQRDGPDEPWHDFIGPTAILAFPMNLILFSLLPSVLMVGFRRRTGIKSTQTADIG